MDVCQNSENSNKETIERSCENETNTGIKDIAKKSLTVGRVSKRLAEKNPTQCRPQYMKQLIPKPHKEKTPEEKERAKKKALKRKRHRSEDSSKLNEIENVSEDKSNKFNPDEPVENEDDTRETGDSFESNIENEDSTNKSIQGGPVEESKHYGSFYCFGCHSTFKTFFQLCDHLFLNHKADYSQFSYCNSCGTAFTNTKDASRHRDAVVRTMPEKPYECNTCNIGFTTQYLLEFHQQGHIDNNCIQCGTCSEEFGNRCADYIKHFRIHLKHFEYAKPDSNFNDFQPVVARFSCTVCNHTNCTPSDFYLHMTTHMSTHDSICICYTCGLGFPDRSQFKKHESEHESNPCQLEYQCDTCSEKFSSSELRHIHKARVHLNVPIFKCDKCLNTFHRGIGLYYHKFDRTLKSYCGNKKYTNSMKHIHLGILASNDNRTFFRDLELGSSMDANYSYRKSEREDMTDYGINVSCAELVLSDNTVKKRCGVFNCLSCEVPIPHFMALCTHLKDHQLKRYDICAVCGFGLSGKQKNEHLLHHIDKNYELLYHCNLCSTKFLNIDLLELHIQVEHKGQSLLRCETCTKEFDKWNKFIRHASSRRCSAPKSSEQNPELRCRFCDKTFKGFNSFIMLQCHEEEQHFLNCHVCKEALQTRTDFEQHKKQHIEEYPYKCGVCRKVLSDFVSLIHHVYLHAVAKDGKAYLCTICSRLFTKKDECEKHQFEHVYQFCNNCEKRLDINTDMKQHMSVCRKVADVNDDGENEHQENLKKRRDYRHNMKKVNLFKEKQSKDIKIYGLLEKVNIAKGFKQDQRRKEKENPLHMFSRIIDDAIDKNHQGSSKQTEDLPLISEEEIQTENTQSKNNDDGSNSAMRMYMCNGEVDDVNERYSIEIHKVKQETEESEEGLMYGRTDCLSQTYNSGEALSIKTDPREDNLCQNDPTINSKSENTSRKQVFLPVIKDGKMVSILVNSVTTKMTGDQGMPGNINLQISIPNKTEIIKESLEVSSLMDDKGSLRHLVDLQQKSFQEDARCMRTEASNVNARSVDAQQSGEGNSIGRLDETNEKDDYANNTISTVGTSEAVDSISQSSDHILEVIDAVARGDFSLKGDQSEGKTLVGEKSCNNIEIPTFGVNILGNRTRSRVPKISSRYSQFFVCGDTLGRPIYKKPYHYPKGRKRMCRPRQEPKAVIVQNKSRQQSSLTKKDLGEENKADDDEQSTAVKNAVNVSEGMEEVNNENGKNRKVEDSENTQDLTRINSSACLPKTTSGQQQNTNHNIAGSTISTTLPNKKRKIRKKMVDNLDDIDIKELVFRCGYCDVFFHNYRHLLLHLDSKHKGSSPHICFICGTGLLYSPKKPYSQQKKEHNDSHTLETVWYCGICKSFCHNQSYLKLHRLYEHKKNHGLFYNCDLCYHSNFVLRGHFFMHYKQCLASTYREEWNSKHKDKNQDGSGENLTDISETVTTVDDSESASRNDFTGIGANAEESNIDSETQDMLAANDSTCLPNKCTGHDNERKCRDFQPSESNVDSGQEMVIAPTRKSKIVSTLFIESQKKKSKIPRGSTLPEAEQSSNHYKKPVQYFSEEIGRKHEEIPDFTLMFSDGEFFKYGLVKPQTEESEGDADGDFRCELCDIRFRHYRDIFLHLRGHDWGVNSSRTRKVICLYCGVGTVINRHMYYTQWKLKHSSSLAHTNLELPLSCSYCNEKFLKPDLLELHEVMHKGRKPIICICGKDFQQNTHFYDHYEVCKRGPTANVNQKTTDKNSALSQTTQVKSTDKTESALRINQAGMSANQVMKQGTSTDKITPGSIEAQNIQLAEDNTNSKLLHVPTATGSISASTTAETWQIHPVLMQPITTNELERNKMIKFKLLKEKLRQAKEIKPKPLAKGITCRVCQKLVMYGWIMCAHGRDYKYINGHICKDCGKVFQNKSNLNLHQRRMHREKRYKCDECGWRFGLRGDWLHHIKNVHNKETDVLKNTLMNDHEHDYCKTDIKFGKPDPEKLRYTDSFDNNIQDESKASDYIQCFGQKFACKKCGFITQTKRNLRKHIHESHFAEKKHKCTRCGKCFVRLSYLHGHMLIHSHQTFPCQFCNKVYYSKRGIAFHLEFVHKDVYIKPKTIKCFHCPMKFAYLKDYLKHRGDVHSNITYFCNVCGMKLSDARNLRKHKERKHGIKTYNLHPNQHSDKSKLQHRQKLGTAVCHDSPSQHILPEVELHGQNYNICSKDVAQRNKSSDIKPNGKVFTMKSSPSKLTKRTFTEMQLKGLSYCESMVDKGLQISPNKRRNVACQATDTDGKKKIKHPSTSKNLSTNLCNSSSVGQLKNVDTLCHATSDLDTAKQRRLSEEQTSRLTNEQLPPTEENTGEKDQESITSDQFKMCEHCGTVLFDERALHIHKMSCQKHIITCKLCGGVFNSYNEAASHKRLEHRHLKYMKACFTVQPQESKEQDENALIHGLGSEDGLSGIGPDLDSKNEEMSDHCQNGSDQDDADDMLGNEFINFLGNLTSSEPLFTNFLTPEKGQAIYTATRIDEPQIEEVSHEKQGTSNCMVPQLLPSGNNVKQQETSSYLDVLQDTSTNQGASQHSIRIDEPENKKVSPQDRNTFNLNNIMTSFADPTCSQSTSNSNIVILPQGFIKPSMQNLEKSYQKPHPEVVQKHFGTEERQQVSGLGIKLLMQNNHDYLCEDDDDSQKRTVTSLTGNVRTECVNKSFRNDAFTCTRMDNHFDEVTVASQNIISLSKNSTFTNSNITTDLDENDSQLDSFNRDEFKKLSNRSQQGDSAIRVLPGKNGSEHSVSGNSDSMEAFYDNMADEPMEELGSQNKERINKQSVLSDKTNNVNNQEQRGQALVKSAKSFTISYNGKLEGNNYPGTRESEQNSALKEDAQVQCDIGNVKFFTTRDPLEKPKEKPLKKPYHEVVKVPSRRYEPYVKCVTVPRYDKKDHTVLVELPSGMNKTNLQVVGMDKDGPDVFLYFN